MEPINRHPLEAITCRSSLSMLETLIPFVDYPLKLPLAIFIKLDEIRLITEVFRSRHSICKFGLHHANTDMMDILCSLTGMSPDMLKMLISLTETMGDSFSPDILSGLTGKSPMDFSNLASMFGQSTDMKTSSASNNNQPDSNNDFSENTSTSSSDFTKNHNASNNNFAENDNLSNNDFDRNLQNIFAEYDLETAEQLENENNTFHKNLS